MNRLKIQNPSRSKYHASEDEINTCFKNPPEDPLADQSNMPIRSDGYIESSHPWCEMCNRAYHRSCDDMFDQLAYRHGLVFGKGEDSIVNTKQLCDVPKNVYSMTDYNLRILKERYQDVETTASDCLKLRLKHHKNCMYNTKTQKREADEGHQTWVDHLTKVRNYCNKGMRNVRKVRMIDTPQKILQKRLDTPHKIRQDPKSMEHIKSVAKKLTFDEDSRLELYNTILKKRI